LNVILVYLTKNYMYGQKILKITIKALVEQQLHFG